MNTNHKFEDAVSDICRLTLKAQLDAPVDREKREAFFKRMLADVMVGASGLFVDIEKVPSEVMEAMAKREHSNLKVSDNVTLRNYRGYNETRMVGTRRYTDPSHQPTIYEIKIDHVADWAGIKKDDTYVFEIKGNTVGHCVIQKIAVAALRTYLHVCKKNCERRAKRRLRNRAASKEGKEA